MAFDVDVGVVSVGVVCYVGGCTGLQLVFDILVYFCLFVGVEVYSLTVLL